MTGRTLVFWLFVFIGLWFFFWSFGTSTFQRQEEVQLFIPEWVVIRDMLSVPGGFCTVVGQVRNLFPFYLIFILKKIFLGYFLQFFISVFIKKYSFGYF